MQDVHPISEPTPVLPFDRAYWVVPGRLLMGYVPVKPQAGGTRQQVRALLDQGIRVFINLMHDDEKNNDGAIIPGYEQELREEAAALAVEARHHRLSIVDVSVPTSAHMTLVLDTIDAALAEGLCWGGRGRTGTVAGCFLARHGYATGQRALDFVQHLRRTDAKSFASSPETQRQCRMVREWPVGA